MLSRLVPSRLAAAVFLAALLTSVMMAAPVPAAGKELSEQEVREWADRLLANAASDRFGADLKLEVVERMTWHPSRAEIDRIKRQVQGRPDHPDRYTIPMWERHLAGDYTEYRYVIWHKSRTAFRESNTSKQGDYQDYIRTPKRAFDISSGRVSYYNPSDYPPRLGPNDVRNYFRYRVGDFANPFLAAMMQGSDPVQITSDGGDWLLFYPRAGSESAGVIYRVSGFDGVPVVTEMTFPGAKVDPGVATRHTFEGIVNDPVLGRPRASMVRYLRSDGAEDRQFVCVSLERLDKAEFDRVTAIPAESRPDPVRGWSDSYQVSDYRGQWHLEPATWGGQAPVPGPDPEARFARSWNWPLVVSISLASLVIGGLVYRNKRA